MVILAIAVTALRVALPRLNSYQAEIESWVGQQTGIPFKLSGVEGYWRNTHPSLSLHGLQAQFSGKSQVAFALDEVQLELDLFASLWALEPKIASLSAYGLDLDISQINLLRESSAAGNSDGQTSDNYKVLRRIDHLLLRQLSDFDLLESRVRYQALTGEVKQLEIDNLKWRNQDTRHRLDGVVSLSSSQLNSLAVIADFEDHGSLLDFSGELYVQARNLSVTPWLTGYMQSESGIQSGQVSLNSWLTFSRSQPVDAYLELLPSELNWKYDDSEHSLLVENGVFKLIPYGDAGEWQVNGRSLTLRTDDTPWPEMDVAFHWGAQQLQLNLSELDIASLLPLAHLAPESEKITEWLDKLGPSGRVEDLRVAYNKQDGALRYSAELRDGGMKQWYLLPELHQLQASIAGDKNNLQASLQLVDDVLPYGDVFQAALSIKNGAVDIAWQRDEQGWRLWSDKVKVTTPDLETIGQFRLEAPDNKSPFLSIYAEADLFNGGETWRYLPTRAMGQATTDYLSRAIQGGSAQTAQVLWYGDLKHFPYNDNSGIFQAKVALEQGQFAFDTNWPAIEQLDIDLLFENSAMYLSSKSAKLMDVQADRITGRIAYLGAGGYLELDAKASAEGNAVRDYMMATPLVDSVGAALTTVQVQGTVNSEFQLKIPFTSKQQVRAWGYADLPGNTVHVKTPEMLLRKAKGRIKFDNDLVSSAGISALLLDQPVSVDFIGESQSSGYAVDIDLVGDWEPGPLTPYVGKTWMEPLRGHAPWSMDVDLQLSDVGFTYQIDTKANLEFVSSRYPAPMNKALGEKGTARMQASGNQQAISARLQLPGGKYQTEIDITGRRPVLTATHLLLGKGSFKISPIVGHYLTVRTDSFNLDDWLSLIDGAEQASSNVQLSQMNTPEIPLPERVNLEVDSLKLATVDWHDVVFSARKKESDWQMKLRSAEAEGEARYSLPGSLNVDLERLHVFIPGLDDKPVEDGPIIESDEEAPLISAFDRSFHQQMPDLELNIQDFWLQGYKVGLAKMAVERQGSRLLWRNIEFISGSNQFKAAGWWELQQAISRSGFTMQFKGDNNSELMERFGISSGIQQAPFEINSNLTWHGAPWSVKTETLSGDMNTRFGKGVISDVSGAAKLLGLFSLDSIIRRMQLDFSDVFDQGLAFDSITGSGTVNQGVFTTQDIAMDAIAGDMTIRGVADLNQRLVDAEVEFIPDLTSGLPVITAFAVTPQTAVVVFAISKVISPVVNVFTKVRYQVKGPLDNPEVKEMSRNTGEYQVPAHLNPNKQER
jgi:uncharacterized protein (TIGR02099 family)